MGSQDEEAPGKLSEDALKEMSKTQWHLIEVSYWNKVMYLMHNINYLPFVLPSIQ